MIYQLSIGMKKTLFKFTVHLEQCFQFSDTHQIPTNLLSVESLWNYLNDGEKIV